MLLANLILCWNLSVKVKKTFCSIYKTRVWGPQKKIYLKTALTGIVGLEKEVDFRRIMKQKSL